ncbi:MAG: acyl-CoA dehydrogenase family protein [Deltaproteobacteria bacterium]|nr:acyl-CoA dehydrogenase family protein [Deltaproteobacteria bacterium]
MIGFELSDEQEELQRSARQFAENEISPVAAELDQQQAFPHVVMKKAHSAGWLNLAIPVSLGGKGRPMLDQVIIAEELARGCTGIASAMLMNELGLGPIISHGTDEQRQRFVKPFVGQLRFAALAYAEFEHCGPLPQTRIEKKADHYLLNGQKYWVSNGGVASQLIVVAHLEGSDPGPPNCALIVDKDFPGISIESSHDKMGCRACEIVVVNFENVKVPFDRLLGGEGRAQMCISQTQLRFRLLVAAMSLGLARSALELAVDWAKRRKVNGQEVASFQTTQLRVAEMVIGLEAGRLLTYQAAWQFDEKKARIKDLVAKCFAGDAAMKAALDAVQIFGSHGYVKTQRIEKLMRDAKMFQLAAGSSDLVRLFIAGEVFHSGAV